MAKPTEGSKAPAFKAPDQDGKATTLAELVKEGWVVLYFYPKDDTPGCTVEACSFRDEYKGMKTLKAKVVGVSPDSPASHQKFIQKFKLPFTLISDGDKTIAQAYGVWVEKSMYGKKYMGVERTTFLIDPKGVIRKVFEKVKPQDHALEIKEALESLR